MRAGPRADDAALRPLLVNASIWALDAAGQPTNDPGAALEGTMLPIGGAKGAALALMVEILAAALTGANFAYQASSFFSAEGPPPRIGQFFLISSRKN